MAGDEGAKQGVCVSDQVTLRGLAIRCCMLATKAGKFSGGMWRDEIKVKGLLRIAQLALLRVPIRVAHTARLYFDKDFSTLGEFEVKLFSR